MGGIDISGYFIIFAAVVIGSAIATVTFFRPRRVLTSSVIAALCGLGLPYTATVVLNPFVSEGAGLGVALVLYALSAFILFAAISAFVGAAARHIWTAIRG